MGRGKAQNLHLRTNGEDLHREYRGDLQRCERISGSTERGSARWQESFEYPTKTEDPATNISRAREKILRLPIQKNPSSK